MRRRGFLGAAGLGAVSAWAAADSTVELRLEPELRVVDLVPDGETAPLILARGRSGGTLVRRQQGNWLREQLPEAAKSAARGAGALWIAGETGIWRRAEAGGTWEKRWEGEGLERILFLGDKGFAAGSGKTILEWEGEGEWRRLPAADGPTTNTANTTYHWIHFITERVGIISGASRPPRKGRTEDYPAWLDSDRASRRKEWPGASITLETRDGGKSWRHSVTSIFGKITRVRYARDGRGLALLEFHDDFEWPGEVFAIDLKTGASERVFRRKDRAVTDTWLYAGKGYLAAIEPASRRVFVYTSDDLKRWEENALVDIEGTRAWLAGTPAGVVWVATDTGLLCRLSEPARQTMGLR